MSTASFDAGLMGSNIATQTAVTSLIVGMLDGIPGANNPLVKVIIATSLPRLTQLAFSPIEKSVGIVGTILYWIFITQIWGWLTTFYYWLRREPVQKKFTVTVAQNNADRQASQLYDAVLWFIMSRTKKEREAAEQLEYFVPKQTNAVVSNMSGYNANQNNASAVGPTKEELEKKLLSTIPQSQQSSFFWEEEDGKRIRVFFSFETESVEIPGEKGRKKENRKIILWRWHTDLKNPDLSDWFNPVFAEILKLYDDSKRSQVWKQTTYVNDKNGQWQKLRNSNTRTLETTVLKSVQEERVRNLIDTFTNEQEIEFARKLGRPNKITFLLHGPPGCGKTTLQQAVSSQLKRDLYYLNLSNVTSNEVLVQLFEKIDNSTGVVVMEEIDVATPEVLNREYREQQANARIEAINRVAQEGGEKLASNLAATLVGPGGSGSAQHGNQQSSLNLEGLLNVLQGNVDADKRILFITSNRVDVLDPALKRPGRVDCEMLMNQCDQYQINRLFQLYYGERFTDEHAVLVDELLLQFLKENEEKEESQQKKLPTPCQLDNLFFQFRDNVERGIESLKQLLEDPTKEIFVPIKGRKLAKDKSGAGARSSTRSGYDE